MPNSDYRIEKERVAVAVTTISGARIDGEIFVQSFAQHHLGREEPADLMNSDDPFFPLAVRGGGTVLLAKDQVREVHYEGAPEDDAANSVGARTEALELTMIDGEVLAGFVFVEVSIGRGRLLDFLNRFRHRFLTLHTPEGVRLVNRRLIERVRSAA